MVIAVVSELVVGRGKFLEALSRDGRKIPGELGELGQHHCAPSHEAVYERFLTHLSPRLTGSISELERELERAQLDRGKLCLASMEMAFFLRLCLAFSFFYYNFAAKLAFCSF